MDLENQRLSFGAVADTYDAHRPGWPAGTAAWLAPPPAHDVLDLGAGTGKLSTTLATAGHRVTALDPSPGMLAALGRRQPGTGAVQAAAERLPFQDGSFDAITVAQAWHWFNPAKAAAECARVLRPGGTLGIGWHVRDIEVEWVAELDGLTGDPVYADRAAARKRGEFRIPAPFDENETETAVFRYEMVLTPPQLAALASTWSYVALRPDRDECLRDIEDLGRRVTGPAGTLTLPHRTYCYRAPTRA